MDDRSLQFLETMAVIGAIGAAAFLVYLVSRHLMRRQPSDGSETGHPAEPHWAVFLIAGIALAVAVAVVMWIFFRSGMGGSLAGDSKSATFLAVMLVIAVLGIVGFAIGLAALVYGGKDRDPSGFGGPVATGEPPPEPSAQPAPARHSPARLRVIGLLAIPVAILILGWTALSHDRQYAVLAGLVYPAAFAVAVVLLFDKATRAWSQKGAAESFREWLFCDGIVFLLVLAHLNLIAFAPAAAYRALIVDMIVVAGFVLVFLAVDRSRARLRFLLAYLYLIALPILLIIWQMVHVSDDAEAPVEAGSWWETAWPVFFLSIIFAVLEVIALIAARGNDNHGLPAAKDAIFVALYAILLLIAIP